jgi:hypothetical protein
MNRSVAIFYVLAFSGGQVGWAVASVDPQSFPPPPPPLTEAPDPNGWLIEELASQRPGRKWNNVVIGANNSIRASYTLTEPEYVKFEGAKAPGGQDLAPLRKLAVDLVTVSRMAGAKGTLSASGVRHITDLQNNVGTRGWIFDNEKDTPDDAGSVVGKRGGHVLFRQPLIDITSPEFVANYSRWVEALRQIEAIVQRPTLATWEGAAAYPEARVKLRCQTGQQRIKILDAAKKPLRDDSVEMPEYLLQRNGDVHEVVLRFNRGNFADWAPILVEHYMKAGPREIGPDAHLAVKAGFLKEGRLKIVDANTISLSAIGLPPTAFQRVR